MRLVSLVPSITETLAQLGVAERVCGVTAYCVHGAPKDARRVGGTKNPDIDAIAGLRPDLVLANTEENRPADLDELRRRDITVLETFPRTVGEVPGMIRTIGQAVAADPSQTAALAGEVAAAAAEARRSRPAIAVRALTLIWRKPWMGVGPGTFVDDLLALCGFGNVLGDRPERYPRLPLSLLEPQVVLLPSEPYAFGEKDIEAVRELAGPQASLEFVDGEQLTWHGPRTASALREFGGLARRYAAL